MGNGIQIRQNYPSTVLLTTHQLVQTTVWQLNQNPSKQVDPLSTIARQNR